MTRELVVISPPRAQVVSVVAGQVYRMRPRRPGAHARYLRVARVRRTAARPPIAELVEVTRSGRTKRAGVRMMSVCTWRDDAWRLRSGYELVELEDGAS